MRRKNKLTSVPRCTLTFISLFMIAAEVGGERILGCALLVTVGTEENLQQPVLRLPVPPAIQRDGPNAK